MAKSKFSDVDEYGFKRDINFDYAAYDSIMTNYYKVLTKRRMKWQNLMKNPSNFHIKSSKLKRYIRKGIPAHIRGEIWMHISGGFKALDKEPLLYQSLLATHYDIEIVDAIRIDLPRTFPENVFFENIRTPLFNVLIAYANHNKDIGYCQGLNYIAEYTFWLLKILIEDITQNYHTKTMRGLITDIGVLHGLIDVRAPEISQHLETIGMPFPVVTTKWFICMFAEVLPVETVLRIWDCVFFEGSKILFRVCLTLFLQHKDDILECDDISVLANLFHSIVKDADATNCHEFINNIFHVPGVLKRTTIERLRVQINSKTVNDKRN
ncbi:growth hormone-regulated TBC protein 1-A isoform X2 [Contarinia nasturtii]|uniref:growth hormone-regulated TBC protein 1-A isoform X2 n=1 Tax=Contarinia nasturtii TaxID=265458 RepID=UPI0012D479F4|nr:growth hormone-regulated TBC protein 1-A isoform X2 [Contarinia nasturtii]